MAELLFHQFCEALVRLAALRYRHLPGLEKRFHTLIQVHLLHQVCCVWVWVWVWVCACVC